jgi:hypothetical protein
MSVRDVSSALKHVHNNLDVDTQWQRARSGLAEMTDLERAQVWTALSSLTLSLDDKTTPVVFSQYKALYKAAMKSVVGKTEVLQCCCVGREGDNVMYHKETGFDGKEHPGGIEYKDQERGSALYCDRATIEMLDKYEKLLEKYQFSIDSFQGMQREGENQLILSVQQIINQSDLWGEMKKQIKDTLDKGLEDLIEEFNTSEIKTALVSIQADKANESSLTNISDTLTAMHSRIDILTSKLDHSTLGNLSTQVNAGTQQIEAMKISLAALIDEMEGLKGVLQIREVERAPLMKGMDDLTKSLAQLVGTTTDQGRQTRTYTDKVDAHIQESRTEGLGMRKYMEDVSAHIQEFRDEGHDTRKYMEEVNAHIQESQNERSKLAKAFNDIEKACAPEFLKLVEDVQHIKERLDKQSYATVEDVHDMITKLTEAQEEQPDTDPEPSSPRAAGGGAKTSKPAARKTSKPAARKVPPTNPYARSARPGEDDSLSEIAKKRGMPVGIPPFYSEFHPDDNDLNWWPSGRASSPSAPGSP